MPKLKKLIDTVRMCACMFCARTFGEYLHSVDGHESFPYARYHWRNRDWAIPTGPFENEGDQKGKETKNGLRHASPATQSNPHRTKS